MASGFKMKLGIFSGIKVSCVLYGMRKLDELLVLQVEELPSVPLAMRSLTFQYRIVNAPAASIFWL
jgi:hypothetical protein